MPLNTSFDYAKAFDRNIGWLKPEDQETLRHARVAIAGVGGAGGYQAQALARLGVGRFKIADLDHFELSNINRQIGASTATLGQSKTQTLCRMIQEINPLAEVECFDQGIHADNIDRFLDKVQVVLDGIDFLEISTKLLLFSESRKRGIPAVTSCPLGFGASLISFMPGGMSFEDYLNIHPSMSEGQKRMALAFGLSPTPLCLSYMLPDAMDFTGGRAASVAPGLMAVGCLAATEVVKILTGRGKVRAAPHLWQIDLFTQKTVRKFYPFGMKGPWMRLKRWLMFRFLQWKTRKGKNS